MNLKRIIASLNEFREERDWRQFHNSKDLAISISLEASELLELFQWKDFETVQKTSLKKIEEEISDILMYCLMLSDDLDIDLENAILEKLEKNKKKYPVDKSKGNSKKYTEF